MFYGEHEHILDKKNRLIIPARFRDAVEELCIEKFYITRGLDKCLFMFAEPEWKLQENKFKSMSFTKKEVRKFRRMFFSGASEAVPDKQWRVLVPDYLKQYAGLTKEIMIIGVSDRIEIWDKDVWKNFYKTSKDSYEDIAENLLDV